MALSTNVTLSLGWPPKPTITTHVHGPNPHLPALAEVIYVEVNSGHYDRLCISGTPRQLRELLVELSAAVRAAIPAARAAAAAHARADAQPEPEPEPAAAVAQEARP
jgi:hypothetical protein